VIPIGNYYHYHYNQDNDNNKLCAGAIAGIIFGVVILFLLLCAPLIVVCVRCYRKKRRSPGYVALQQQYPRILQATNSNDVVSDSETHGVNIINLLMNVLLKTHPLIVVILNHHLIIILQMMHLLMIFDELCY